LAFSTVSVQRLAERNEEKKEGTRGKERVRGEGWINESMKVVFHY